MVTHLAETLGSDPAPSATASQLDTSAVLPTKADAPRISASDVNGLSLNSVSVSSAEENLSGFVLSSSPCPALGDQFVPASPTNPEEHSPIEIDLGPADQNSEGFCTSTSSPSFPESESDASPNENLLSYWRRCPCSEFDPCPRCLLIHRRKNYHRNSWGHWRKFEPTGNPWGPFFAPAKVEIEPTGVGAGMSNLGNTCFINAVLQCFTHTVPFVQGLRSLNDCNCGGEDFCILCALRDHIDLAINSSGGVISPSKIFDNLKYISSDFQRYHQEDAHEFLICLLDKLESCLDANCKDTGQSSGDDNLIKQVFGGRLVSKLSCCNCGHRSETHEPMNHLSLEIEDMDTLSSALESFTCVEKLNPEEKFKCENCKEEVSIEKQLLLDQVPPIVAFHLKRFKNDGCSVEKIDKHVEFPLELDLQAYTISNQSKDVELKYHLYAVVEHYGFRLSSGHYISYVRSSPDTWHMLNDSQVTRAKEKSVLSEGAYILFYSRQDIPWFSSAIKVQKPCLNHDVSNASPKSVLDNVDGESASPSRAENTDECMSQGSENAADRRATITSETKSGDDVNETITAGDISACHDYELNQDVSELTNSMMNAPVFDSSVLCGSSVSLGDTQNEGKRCNRDAEKVGQGSSFLETPDKSHVPDVAQGGSSGTSREAYFIRSKNLKACQSAHLKSSNSCSIDRGKMEAVRFVKKNMTSSRGARLIHSLLGPKTPVKQKRMGSSPCKRVSPGKRKRKESAPSVRVSPRKLKRSC